MAIPGFNIGALNLGDLEIFLDFINEQENLESQPEEIQVTTDEKLKSPFNLEDIHEIEYTKTNGDETEDVLNSANEEKQLQAADEESIVIPKKTEDNDAEIEKLKLELQIKKLEVEKLKLESIKKAEEKQKLTEKSEEVEQEFTSTTVNYIPDEPEEIVFESIEDETEYREYTGNEIKEQRELKNTTKLEIEREEEVKQKADFNKQERIKELLRKRELLQKIREEKQRKEKSKHDTKTMYSDMKVNDLFEEVKLFMIQNGVQHGVMRRDILDNKFGQNNIAKLIMQNYLILSSKGVTIGR